jgi:hypothetical protein
MLCLQAESYILLVLLIFNLTINYTNGFRISHSSFVPYRYLQIHLTADVWETFVFMQCLAHWWMAPAISDLVDFSR